MTKNKDIANILDQATMFSVSTTVGNSTVNVTMNSTTFSGTANNATYLGGVAAAGYVIDADLDAYQTEAGLAANVATLTANDSLYLGGVAGADYQTEAGLSDNVATLAANNTTYLGGSIFANSIGLYPTSNTVGMNYGNTIARPIITANSITLSGVLTGAGHTANSLGLYPTSNTVGQLFGNTISRWEIFANTLNITGIITANGAAGVVDQVLTSNSTGGTYWANSAGGAASYSENIGNASNTSFTVTHNLNIIKSIIAVREISSGYYVYPDVIHSDSNNCLIEFVSAPTANQYFVIVMGA